ncbi:energy transducer TonB [Roseicella aquatilis]|uniref:TonB C-terminal domain-containing protein n=1 Tax=Roseicella aquatilis TaxID=2527868 RepID=A0A4R4DB27_9PROT|nr:energy transducer TonB [Roseicella aquatilis]TCZ57214.1 hypothetical protein EXY23_18935 [Roseicella aquatilis]
MEPPGATSPAAASRRAGKALAWPALAADPALQPRPRRPRRRDGLRPGLVASLLLHGGFFALLVLAALTRPPPAEPLPPPSYAMVFQSGAPEQPAQQDLPSPPPAPPAPPLPTPQPEVAPAPPVPPVPTVTAPPRPPADTRLATAAAPPPPPAVPQAEALPLPPPPPPAPPQERPQQEAAVIAPPRPAQPSQRLPGIWMPDASRLAPGPRTESAARPPLDLSLGSLSVIGRSTPEPQLSVRGAEVTADWRNAFRRWLDENVRYPQSALVVGDQGTNRIRLVVSPDGKVRSGRLIRRSGSVWLDSGLEIPFRNAILPSFPPGADPEGVEIDLTVHWQIIRR